MKYCRKCGQPSNDDAMFCRYCANAFSVTTGQPAAEAPSGPAPEAPAEPVAEAVSEPEKVTVAEAVNEPQPEPQPAPQPEVQPAPQPEVQPAPQPAPADAAAAPAKAPMDKKKLLKILIPAAAAVVLLIVIIIIVASVAGGGGGSYKSSYDSYYYTLDDDDNLYVISPKGVVTKMSDIKDVTSFECANGEAGLFEIIESGASSSELYYYNGKALTRITDEYVTASLTMNGDKAYYLVEADSDDFDYSLYVFDGKTSKKVKDGAIPTAFSPDGNSIGYYEFNDDDEIIGHYMVNGKEYDLGKNRRVFAISNNAKYVYFIKESGEGSISFYVMKNGNEDDAVKLFTSESYSSYSGILMFNRDLSQILYEKEGKSYVCADAKEPQKIFSSSASILAVPIYGNSNNNTGAFIYDIAGFADNIYAYSSDSSDSSTLKFAYLNKNYESETIVSASSVNVRTSEDYKTLYVLKNGNLLKCNGKNPSAEPVKLIEDEIDNLTYVTGNKVCYTYDDEILVKTGNNKPVKIVDESDVKDFGFFKGKGYFVTDDKLKYSDGGKAQTVPKLNDVKYLDGNDSVLIVEAEDYVFYSVDGTTFTKLYDK
ncbi:MAG: zinc ribbon domain-containing protein [Clostridia bacterium]|nr:zinc ribbon domain-containing protein [Clostridia bacterium]